MQASGIIPNENLSPTDMSIFAQTMMLRPER